MPGTGHIIDELFIFVALHADNDEGVVATPMGDVAVPLVASDRARMESLLPMAQAIADASGYTITVARLSVREDLFAIVPADALVPEREDEQ